MTENGKLKKEADAWFSRRIRLQYADWKGDVKCYTCSTIKPWKQMQCGHYIRRGVSLLRFEERNVRPQCSGCNMFNPARAYPIYSQNIIKEKGLKKLNWLIGESKKIHSFTTQELKDIIAREKEKISKLDNASLL